VIVDPAEYQRRPDEPERPLRTPPFGLAGLVTFLVYEPRPALLEGFLASTGLDFTPFCNPTIRDLFLVA